jgi:hypothetical protein
MKSAFPAAVSLLAICQAALGQSITPVNGMPNPPAPTALAIRADYGKLPLSFEANEGQSGSQVKFSSRGNGYSLFLTEQSAVLALTKPDPTANRKLDRFAGKAAPKPTPPPKTDVVRMELVGASRASKVEGAEQLPGTANYFIGNDPAKWRTNVPTFAKVKYTGVYPGVDLIYYGNQGHLEYDFVVAPKADPKMVRLHFEGGKQLRLEADGGLTVVTKDGKIAFPKPVVYQVKDGRREPVDGRFNLLAQGRVAFAISKYDHERELVIDPVLIYSTFLGQTASGDSFSITGTAIAADSSGNAYITGTTNITDFPTTAGSLQPTDALPGNPIAFVSKLNAAGSALVYSTYLGGASGSPTGANAIAIDSSGQASIAGETSDATFPVTHNAWQSVCGGYSNPSPGVVTCGDNAFVSTLNATGSSLVYSTYYSGNQGQTSGFGVAADAAGNVYLSGSTTATDLPAINGFQTVLGDTSGKCSAESVDDLFLAKFGALTAATPKLVYSTYLGGSGQDTPNLGVTSNSLAVDTSQNAYLTGTTSSPDFPTTSTAYQPQCGADGACNGNACTQSDGQGTITRIDTTKIGAASLIYSSYLGGASFAFNTGAAVDNSGHAYITGWTQLGFPVTQGAAASCLSGGTDTYVAELNTGLSGNASLLYATCLGDTSGAFSSGIAVDAAGHAYVEGVLNDTSRSFPLVNPIQSDGGEFISEIASDGSSLLWSTRLGGDQPEVGGIALDSSSNIYALTGPDQEPDFPTTAGSFSPDCTAADGCTVNEDVPLAVIKIGQAHGATATLNPLNPAFGEVEITAPAYFPSSAVTLRDMGDEAYSVSSIALGGADAGDFTLTSNSCPIGSFGPASNCSITINFAPTATGTRTATLTVTDTAPGSPRVATISGIGDKIALVPANLTFPAQPVGTSSAAKTIQLTNVATSRSLAFAAGSITAAGDFSESDTCSGTILAPNASCSISVVFAPAATGPLGGGLTINDTGEPSFRPYVQSVSLTGFGGIATATALKSSLNPSTAGEAVTFTATVTATSGATPTGTVTFTHGGVAYPAATLSDGVATYTTSSQSAGKHSIQAIYSGSSADATSNSAELHQVVLNTTITSLTSSLNPSTLGQAVTFTATVTASSGAAPTGTVTFTHGGVAYPAVTLSDGVATYTTSATTAGTHSIQAIYSGSSANAASTSAELHQVVLNPTKTSLVSSLNPSTVGQAVTFTATVTASSGAAPTGTVTFTHGGVAYPAVTLSGGVATYTTSAEPVGTHSIQAIYSGSSTDAASDSAELHQVVNQ